jgi:hypothetical protein
MKESDWKLFRKPVPAWRERYLEEKNAALRRLLDQPDQTSTTIFWQCEEFVDEQARVLVHCFDGHLRAKMEEFLALMIRHKVVSQTDFNEFSEELRARLG